MIQNPKTKPELPDNLEVVPGPSSVPPESPFSKVSGPGAVDLSYAQLQEKVKLMEQKIELQKELPFLYGWKWYKWAREFFDSTTKINLLVAGNQLSKSSTQIRKCIDWATRPERWQELWPALGKDGVPNQFWYFYPTNSQALIEFETKWKQFLPNGSHKDHPQYGWKVEIKDKALFAIHFNTGVHVYFKTYAQKASSLQTATVYSIFADEEMPMDLYDEIMFRLSAASGYFHMVFTATLGQDFWRRCMEPGKYEKEELTLARKWIVEAYDCLFYTDGTASHWSEEKIELVKAQCKSPQEVLKRVYGRFIKESGLKYPQFDMVKHVRPAHPIPANWMIYAGVDIGSGGQDGHPSAICFIGVDPEHTRGRVFLAWRGDKIQTTAGDVLRQYQLMVNQYKLNVTSAYYDWANKDFEMIATRTGQSFMKADKSHDVGEQVINTLFKNDMMHLYDHPEVQKLAAEMSTLQMDAPKRKAVDDLADAFRYGVTKIPWDWSVIQIQEEQKKEVEKSDMEKRTDARRGAEAYKEVNEQWVEDEFEEWNGYYG